MAVLSRHTTTTLALITALVFGGTLYSIDKNTFLDTSNPLLAHLPHPAHAHSYFASKHTILNQVFVKFAWAWTSAAFWTVWCTANEQNVVGGFNSLEAVGKWVGATAIWGAFASWFFGPSLFARLLRYSGAECVITIPSSPAFGTDAAPHLVSVPVSYCAYRTTVTPQTHPEMFVLPDAKFFAEGSGMDPGFKAVPRLYRGHDVSGHTFLLTLSILFLVDALVRARRSNATRAPTVAPIAGQSAAWLLVGLWLVMLLATAVYFHTWQEKASGLVIGVVGFVLSQWPFEPWTDGGALKTKKQT